MNQDNVPYSENDLKFAWINSITLVRKRILVAGL
jgi:hypothetical protein